MRTANNNFTVESLVAKYRNFVKEHCPKACEFDGVHEFLVPISPNANADEQLLVTLYSSVAGNDADKQVLLALTKYAEKYQNVAFDEKEYAFLCKHFNEVVAYEFSHRSEWTGGFIVGASVPSQFLEIIHEMATPKDGQTVFVADAGLGDVAVLFPGCVVKGFTGYCGSTMFYNEVWALCQIRLYAAGVKSEIVPGLFDESKEKYMYTLPDEESADVVIYGTTWDSECEDVYQLYRLLRPNGTMFLFSDRKGMAGDGKEKTLRKQLVCDKAIQLLGSFEGEFIGIATDIILAFIRKTVNKTVEIVNGKRGSSTVVKSEELDSEILWPSYYMASRPSEGKPLSSIVELASNQRLAKFEKGKGYILPDEEKGMLLVLPNNLADSYKDANLWSKSVNQIGDPAFEEKDWIRFRVVKEPCVLLNGSSDKLTIGYTTKVPEKGFAFIGACCMVAKKGIDVRYVAALLFEPLVKEQILTICDGNVSERNLSLVLDKIIVPEHDDKERLRFLIEANEHALLALRAEKDKAFDEKLLSMKTEYINEVRMRKHDMGQYIFELMNIEDLMRYYIENRDKESDFETQIKNLLDNFKLSLNELSTLLDNLSKEDQFGEPEIFNLDDFLSHLSSRHKAEGFKIEYVRDESSIKRYNQKKYLDDTMVDAMIEAEIQAHEEETVFQDAMIDAEIQAHEEEMAMQDAIANDVVSDVVTFLPCKRWAF